MLNGISVLVTGSSGFIGSNVVEALKQQQNIKVIGDYDLANNQDILDMENLNLHVEHVKPNWIVHLAGQAFLEPSLKSPQRDALCNIVGTLNILEVARKHKCGVIFSSSGAIYGNNFQYPEPISPYGISKLTAERYCQLYHKLYCLRVVVFRLSSVYGKGRKASVTFLLEKAIKNETIQVTGDGEQTRDFTHISDVVEAIILAVNGKFPSGIYDIGTGLTYSLNELLHLISKLLDKSLVIEHVQTVETDPQRNELNVSKAAIYGFKAKISLEEGIAQLIRELR